MLFESRGMSAGPLFKAAGGVLTPGAEKDPLKFFRAMFAGMFHVLHKPVRLGCRVAPMACHCSSR